MGEGERRHGATAELDKDQLARLAQESNRPEERPTSALDPTELRGLLAQSGATPLAVGSQPIGTVTDEEVKRAHRAATVPAPVAEDDEPSGDVVELDDGDRRTQKRAAEAKPRLATGSELEMKAELRPLHPRPAKGSTPIAKTDEQTEPVRRFRPLTDIEEPRPPQSDVMLAVVVALVILVLGGTVVFLMMR